jgi:hypothetical protein
MTNDNYNPGDDSEFGDPPGPNCNRRPTYRAAIFGLGRGERIVMVHGPTKIEDCGMYIHVDDIPAFLNERDRDEF